METEKRRREVPKFESFKPKPTSEPGSDRRPALEETQAPSEGDRRNDGERRRRERERERERESRHSHRERERRRDRDRRHSSQPGSPEVAPRPAKDNRKDPAAQSNDLFTIDKRGDPLILQYGSNDRSRVPSYYRSGAVRILGSTGFLTIHRDGLREQFSISGHREGGGSSAFRDKALVAAVGRSTPRRIRPLTSERPPAPSDDFIPLLPSRKRKRGEEDPAGFFPKHETPDYRSIYGKARPGGRLSDDDDSSSGSDSDASPSPDPESDTEMSTAKRRSIELSRQVKDNPGSIAAWLELIKLQDELLLHEGAISSSAPLRPRTADETRALAELKLSLYKEALALARAPADRERLLAGMLREGAKAWDPQTLARKWDEVARTEMEGGSFVLWKGRLDFELTRVATFTYEELSRFFTEKLRSLGGRLREAGTSAGGADGKKEAEEVSSLCGQLVYVFLRLTCFLHDCGYAELAVAAWQAMLEVAFCRPTAAEGNAESALSSFAEFWESEVPRLGEEGAKGWRQFVEVGGDVMADPALSAGVQRDDDAGNTPRSSDPIAAWAAAEQQASAKARMPARTLDEGPEDDPFRVVMFSDIKDFLVWFPSPVLPRVRLLLLDAFLVFCGLPAACLSGDEFAALLNDPFVHCRSQVLDLGLGPGVVGASSELSKRAPEFRPQGGIMAISPELLFSGNSWFRYLDRLLNTHQPGDRRVDASWVLCTLRYLVKMCGIEELAEYYLALEWLNEPAGARKVAKGLLKQYSSNIRLYNAYALVEQANQNCDISHKVLSSATGLALSSASSDAQLLWNTWAWIHLESGQKQAALVRLCSSVARDFDGSAVSPALLLKARSHFSSTRDYSLSSLQLENATQHAESLMLLDYFADEGGSEPASEMQGNITAALSSVHAFSREMQSRNLGGSPHHERLLQAAARLLYYHATHGPYRPVYIREQVLSFMKRFPQNIIFLELFAWAESSLRIDDPVRAMLQTVALAEPHDCLSTRRFAIRHEARVGTVHSTRAAFEAALDSEACRGSVALWICYVRFCCSVRELRAKAKEVFYRAIAACPWAKELYMEAFRTLAGEFGSSELRAVFNTMAAKGLRIHVDLEEFVERWKGNHEQARQM
ncbi:hypothetical protein VTK56DRAFT_3477 [Thermocarpiscus australiensis]